MAVSGAVQAFTGTKAGDEVSPVACISLSPTTKSTTVPEQTAVWLRVKNTHGVLKRRNDCQMDGANMVSCLMENCKQGSDEVSTPFTIRGFVASVRDTDQKATWPFTEGSLNWRTRQRGDQPGLLPPLGPTSLSRLFLVERNLQLAFAETRWEAEDMDLLNKKGSSKVHSVPNEGQELKRSFSLLCGSEGDMTVLAATHEASQHVEVGRAITELDTYEEEGSDLCDLTTSGTNVAKDVSEDNPLSVEVCNDQLRDTYQVEPMTSRVEEHINMVEQFGVQRTGQLLEVPRSESFSARSKTAVDGYTQKLRERGGSQAPEPEVGELLDKLEVRGHSESRADLSEVHEEYVELQGRYQTGHDPFQGDDTWVSLTEGRENADVDDFVSGNQGVDFHYLTEAKKNAVQGDIITSISKERSEIVTDCEVVTTNLPVPHEGEEGECLVCKDFIPSSNTSLDSHTDKAQAHTMDKSSGQGAVKNQVMKIKVQKKRSLADLCASAPRLDIKNSANTNLLRMPDGEEQPGLGRTDRGICRQPRTPFYRGPSVGPKKVRSTPSVGVHACSNSSAVDNDVYRGKKSRVGLVSKRPVNCQQDIELRKKRRQLVIKRGCGNPESSSINGLGLSVAPPAVVASNQSGDSQSRDRNWIDASASTSHREDLHIEDNNLDGVPMEEEFVAGNQLSHAAVVDCGRGMGNVSEASSILKAQEESMRQGTSGALFKKWNTSGNCLLVVPQETGSTALTTFLPPSAPRNKRVGLSTTNSKSRPRKSTSTPGVSAYENNNSCRSVWPQHTGSGQSSAGMKQLDTEKQVREEVDLSISAPNELINNHPNGLKSPQLKAVVVKHKQRIFSESPVAHDQSVEGRTTNTSVQGVLQPRKKLFRREKEFLKAAVNAAEMSVLRKKNLKRKEPASSNLRDDLSTPTLRRNAILQKVPGTKQYLCRGQSYQSLSGCTPSRQWASMECRVNAPACQRQSTKTWKVIWEPEEETPNEVRLDLQKYEALSDLPNTVLDKESHQLEPITKMGRTDSGRRSEPSGGTQRCKGFGGDLSGNTMASRRSPVRGDAQRSTARDNPIDTNFGGHEYSELPGNSSHWFSHFEKVIDNEMNQPSEAGDPRGNSEFPSKTLPAKLLLSLLPTEEEVWRHEINKNLGKGKKTLLKVATQTLACTAVSKDRAEPAKKLVVPCRGPGGRFISPKLVQKDGAKNRHGPSSIDRSQDEDTSNNSMRSEGNFKHSNIAARTEMLLGAELTSTGALTSNRVTNKAISSSKKANPDSHRVAILHKVLGKFEAVGSMLTAEACNLKQSIDAASQEGAHTKGTGCAAKSALQNLSIEEVQISQSDNGIIAARIGQQELAYEASRSSLVNSSFPGGRGHERSVHVSPHREPSGLKQSEERASGQPHKVRRFGSHELRLMGRNVVVWQEEKPEVATLKTDAEVCNISPHVGVEQPGIVEGSGVSAGFGPAVAEPAIYHDISGSMPMINFTDLTLLQHEPGHQKACDPWNIDDVNIFPNRVGENNSDGQLLVTSLSRKQKFDGTEQQSRRKVTYMDPASNLVTEKFPVSLREVNNHLLAPNMRQAGLPLAHRNGVFKVEDVPTDNSLRDYQSVETLLTLRPVLPDLEKMPPIASDPVGSWCPLMELDHSNHKFQV